jgi:chromate transporter
LLERKALDLKNKLKIAWRLFTIFFRIGAFTFGGGYAMIPLIQKETVETHHLIDEKDILDIVAIAESTPGPIAINSATFIGYQAAGVVGSLGATLGVVLPSFVIILLISFFLRQFMEYDVVRYAFTGIRAGVLALIFKAFVSMYKQCPKGAISYLIAGAAFLISTFTDWSVLIIILSAAMVGLATYLIFGEKEEKQ